MSLIEVRIYRRRQPFERKPTLYAQYVYNPHSGNYRSGGRWYPGFDLLFQGESIWLYDADRQPFDPKRVLIDGRRRTYTGPWFVTARRLR